MISRTASELSLRSDTSGKRLAGDYNILSRHYVPTDFGPLTKLAFPYRLIGTLATMDVEKKQFGVLVKHGKYNPEKLVRAVHDYYATKDDEIEVSDEDKEKDKKEAKKVKDKAKKEKDEAKDEKDEAVKFNTKRCQPVKQDEIIAGHIYAAYIQELKKFARLRVAEINRISARSSANQLTVHLLDYGMITTILEGELIKLDDFFTEGAYKTALALACQLPTGRAPFPRLENFELGDHVEVYVLSDEEPCLAVFGSLAPTQKSISRDLLFHGVNPKYVDILQRAMNGKIPAEPQKRKGWALNDSMLFSSWNVVSILSCEDPTNIAVRDTSTSLRFLRLQDNINRAYKKADFRKAMEIDAAELYSGTPVVVYFPPCNTLLRGTVTSVHPNGCDVEALDIPDFTVYNAPINHVFYPPSLLLNVPPQIFYFNLMKGCETTIESCDLLKERLDRNSVGTLRLSSETGCAQLVAGKKIDITKIFQEYLSTLIVEDSEKSDGDADVEHSDMGGEVGEAQDGEAQDDDDGRSNVSFTD